MKQMLSAFLAGMVLHVHTADSKESKERVVTLDPTLLKLNWISFNPSKGRLHDLLLDDITVWMKREYEK